MINEHLNPRERYVLSALAASDDSLLAPRAQLLLKWARGEPAEQIAETLSKSLDEVQHWTSAFAANRLEIFAPSEVEWAARGWAGLVSISALLQRQHVNPLHPRHVATLALQLFDQTVGVHELPRGCRGLLAAAALLHNVGWASDEKKYQRAGRSLILAHTLENLSERERDVLACVVGFHRQKVKPADDLIFARMDAETQSLTLRLAAMLRIADGLDDSLSQRTRVQSVHVNNQVDVVVAGPHAEADAKRANKQANLWQQVMPVALRVRLADEPAQAPDLPDEEPRGKLSAQEPITRAGQRIVRTQFEKLKVREADVRADSDIEAVHDVRVAARRMRSLLRLLDDHYRAKDVKGVLKPLRKLARTLGGVRDLDVLIKNAGAYEQTLPAERQTAFERLLAHWHAQRETAQRAALDYLDSKKHQAWLERVQDFVRAPLNDAPRVCEAVPLLVWSHYAAVRSYEGRLHQAAVSVLHELRIECKRLRYALEFFAPVLGDSTPLLIESLVGLQDHLGELHDADVARQRVVALIGDQTAREQAPVDTLMLQEATAYLGVLQDRIGVLRATFHERWQVVNAPEFRRALAEALAVL